MTMSGDPVNGSDLNGQCGFGNPFKKCGPGHHGGTNIISGAIDWANGNDSEPSPQKLRDVQAGNTPIPPPPSESGPVNALGNVLKNDVGGNVSAVAHRVEPVIREGRTYLKGVCHNSVFATARDFLAKFGTPVGLGIGQELGDPVDGLKIGAAAQVSSGIATGLCALNGL